MTQPKWTDLFGIDPTFSMAPDDYEQGRLAGLAEAAALIEALSDKWSYKGEFGWGPWQEGYGPGPEGQALDDCAAEVRTVLAVLKSGGAA